MQSPSGSERRLLVAAGTEHYEKLAGRDLPQVPDELRRIAAAFASFGYETSVTKDPDRQQLHELYRKAGKGSQDGDLIVAYYTGHGAKDEHEGRFYVLTRDTESDDLATTALAAEDLARALIINSNAAQILVILDCCYSGKGTAELAEIADRIAARSAKGPEVYAIAAARPKQEADEGALSMALGHALANTTGRLGGHAQPYLYMEEVMGEVGEYLRTHHPSQQARLRFDGISSRFFRNPQHDTQLRAGLDLETQRAWREHWIVKASGVELGASGWYFTGRRQALSEIAGWLHEPASDGRARVVTGGAGCGKSAVLAQIVTLATPMFQSLRARNAALAVLKREELLGDGTKARPDAVTIPPLLSIVAIHARRKLLSDVVAQIGSELKLEGRDAAELVEAIAQRGSKTAIVLDALDEADEREQLVLRLLRPLAALPHVFLLVGTRPDTVERERRFGALGESTVEIDLDSPRYVGVDDVAIYVERRLLAVEEPGRWTPYRDAPDIAHAVAKGVAARAGNVFIVAYAAVQALLAEAAAIDVSQQQWIERLPAGVDAALGQFLAHLDTTRPDGLTSAKARATLLPLALAAGEGLPWVDIWAATASALTETTISDVDIAAVRKHAAAFIVEATEQGRSVYRLYHERLAEYLRRTLPDAADAHRRMTNTLLSRVPPVESMTAPDARDWSRAHAYVRSHLAEHAARAGMLDTLVVDPGFLAAADPWRLLPRLGDAQSPDARAAANAYRSAMHRLVQAAPGERLAYLELAAHQTGARSLAAAIDADAADRPWRARWANWSSFQPSRIVLRMQRYIGAVALAELDGRTIALATDGSSVVAHDLEGGALWSVPLPAFWVTVWRHPSAPRVVAGCEDGSLHWLDLADGRDCGSVPDAHGCGVSDDPAVRAVEIATLDGIDIAVTAGNDGKLAVWNLATRNRIGEPISGFAGSIQSLALVEDSGRLLAVAAASPAAGDETELIRCWDLRTRALVHRYASSSAAMPGALAFARRAGGLWIVSSTFKEGLHAIEVATGTRHEFAGSRQQAVSDGLAVGAFEGEAIVAAGVDIDVGVWRFRDGRPLGRLVGHDSLVNTVATGTVRGRSVVVSGGHDECVRIWDLGDALAVPRPAYGRLLPVLHIALATVNGRRVVVSGSLGLRFAIWDFDTGDYLHGFDAQSFASGLDPEDYAMAAVAGGPNALNIFVGGNGRTTIVVIELGIERAKVNSIHHAGAAVSALAGGTRGGHAHVVAAHVIAAPAGHAAQLQFFAFAPGLQYAASPLELGPGAVRELALNDGGHTLALYQTRERAIGVWDLNEGRWLVEGLGADFKPRSIAVTEGAARATTLVAAGNSWGDVALWELSPGGWREPRIVKVHGATTVSAVAFMRLGTQTVVASGGEDRDLVLTSLDGRELRRVAVGAEIRRIAVAGPGDLVLGTSQGLARLSFG